MFTLVITRGSKVQQSRLDASSSAQSGYGRAADVSTGEGALKTIPLGMVYFTVRALPLATGLVATKYHLARDGDLVGFVSVVDFGALVLDKVPLATNIAGPDFYSYAFAGLLNLSG